MSDARVIPIHRQDERLTAEIQAAIRIVEGIRAGDSKSETELVQRYSHGLHYLLSRKTGDEERTKDLVQETLLIAIRKLREQPLENPQRLAGYLRGIAIRVALNAGRRRQREPYGMEIDAIAQIPDRENHADEARP
jgi:DNA-directed RNA polymerase specialized sigma24 family protein